MAKGILQRIELWNILHELEVKDGRRESVTVDAKADNGSVYTILPQALVDQLGPRRRATGR